MPITPICKGVGTHKPYTQIAGLSRERALSLLCLQWYFDWSATPQVYPGLEAVPMVWDEKGVGVISGGNSDWILGFNEPDSSVQANMTLDQAARLWKKLDELNPGKKLVSPAPTADNWVWRDMWLTRYMETYNELPRVDAVSVHIYSRTWDYFIQAMGAARDFAEIFGVRVWVTEYAFLPCWPGGRDEAMAMMSRMTGYFLDHPETFERWAPFILSARGPEGWNFHPDACNPALVDFRTGELTLVGEVYAKTEVRQYADPGTDLTGDGHVDILDLARLAANFGLKTEHKQEAKRG